MLSSLLARLHTDDSQAILICNDTGMYFSVGLCILLAMSLIVASLSKTSKRYLFSNKSKLIYFNLSNIPKQIMYLLNMVFSLKNVWLTNIYFTFHISETTLYSISEKTQLQDLKRLFRTLLKTIVLHNNTQQFSV